MTNARPEPDPPRSRSDRRRPTAARCAGRRLPPPDPGNARAGHDLEEIAASPRIYGRRAPIVINSDEAGEIEKSRDAYSAAAEILGRQHITAVKDRHDPTTAVRYAIAGNRTAAHAT